MNAGTSCTCHCNSNGWSAGSTGYYTKSVFTPLRNSPPKLWALHTSNIHVIVCSHHTTKGGGTENVTPGCMEFTYGDDEKYWSIFHHLVVWSVRTEYFSSLGCMECTYGNDEKYWSIFHQMMNITRVFFIFPVRTLHTTRWWTSALFVWRLRTQIRILPVRSLNTAGGEKYSSSMLRRLRPLRWESDYRVCRSVITHLSKGSRRPS
jgi:hypothetical protein